MGRREGIAQPQVADKADFVFKVREPGQSVSQSGLETGTDPLRVDAEEWRISPRPSSHGGAAERRDQSIGCLFAACATHGLETSYSELSCSDGSEARSEWIRRIPNLVVDEDNGAAREAGPALTDRCDAHDGRGRSRGQESGKVLNRAIRKNAFAGPRLRGVKALKCSLEEGAPACAACEKRGRDIRGSSPAAE